MAKVEIVKSLFEEIEKKFKQDADKIYDLMGLLGKHPKKGKLLGIVGGVAIKELKYEGFRFFFIGDAHKLKFLQEEDLVDLLLKFVRMSSKKHQQKTIDEIRAILRKIGPQGFT